MKKFLFLEIGFFEIAFVLILLVVIFGALNYFHIINLEKFLPSMSFLPKAVKVASTNEVNTANTKIRAAFQDSFLPPSSSFTLTADGNSDILSASWQIQNTTHKATISADFEFVSQSDTNPVVRFAITDTFPSSTGSAMTTFATATPEKLGNVYFKNTLPFSCSTIGLMLCQQSEDTQSLIHKTSVFYVHVPTINPKRINHDRVTVISCFLPKGISNKLSNECTGNN